MRAVLKRAGVVTVAEVPSPQPAAGELVLRVAFAGLCRTDLYVAQGRIATPDPIVLGHELSGVVARLGAGVSDWRVGERVTVNPLLPCGGCSACLGGAPCTRPQQLGVHRDGAFAEELCVPAHAVHRIPDSLSLALAAYSEPVAAAMAVLQAGLRPSERGLIHGDNRVAHLTARIMAAYGFAAIETHAPGSAAPGSAELRDDGYDFAIETVLDDQALAELVRVVRPRGTIVIKSRLHTTVALPVAQLVQKQLTLRAVFYGAMDEAIALLASRRIEVDDLIGARYRLADAADAFAAAQSGEARKVLLEVGGESS